MSPDSSLAFEAHGRAGPHVLLLHGIPGTRATFERVALELAPRFRVIAPDLLGFGASPEAPRHFHAAHHAEALAGFLDERKIDEIHLVGFDFGGPTAVHLAARLPGRVRSITVAATNLFPDTHIPLPLRLARVPGLGRLFFRLAFGAFGLKMMWRAAVADRAAFPFERYRAYLLANVVRSTRRIFFASMRNLAGLYAEVERTARSLHLPAAVLWGDRDPFFPVAVGERTAIALGAELTLLRGCGHFVPEERPLEMAHAVIENIARSARR